MLNENPGRSILPGLSFLESRIQLGEEGVDVLSSYSPVEGLSKADFSHEDSRGVAIDLCHIHVEGLGPCDRVHYNVYFYSACFLASPGDVPSGPLKDN